MMAVGTAMTYQWKAGRPHRAVKAQDVGEAVARIAETEGYCPPSRLVEEAASVSSPLHSLFTWDDTTAAARWRNHEARDAINSISVTVEHDGRKDEVPAFISVGHLVATQGAGEGYRPISVVMSTPDLASEAEREVKGKLLAIRRRHGVMQKYAAVWAAIDEVVAAD